MTFCLNWQVRQSDASKTWVVTTWWNNIYSVKKNTKHLSKWFLSVWHYKTISWFDHPPCHRQKTNKKKKKLQLTKTTIHHPFFSPTPTSPKYCRFGHFLRLSNYVFKEKWATTNNLHWNTQFTNCSMGYRWRTKKWTNLLQLRIQPLLSRCLKYFNGQRYCWGKICDIWNSS